MEFFRGRRRRRRGNRSRTENPDHRLSAWRRGEEGVVSGVSGSSRLAARLRELGVVPGERIRLLRSGDPLIVQVGEGRFSLRRRDASAIRACPLDRRSSGSQAA